MKIINLCLVLLLSIVNHSNAKEDKKITYSGRIIDYNARPVKGKDQIPNEEQLVAFYQAAAQKSLFRRDRWIIKVDDQKTIQGAILKTAARKYLDTYTVYRDRDRIDSRKERIRMDFPEDKNKIDKMRTQHVILDGRVYSYNGWMPEGEPPDRLIASNNLTGRVLLSAGSDALSLAGYMLGDKKPLAEILAEESSVLHAQPSMQVVNGFPTYVLEATTPYGHYTVWMDPNCGCSPRRVIVERGPKDLYGGKPVSTPPPKPIPGARRVNPMERRPTRERARFELDILKIKEIGGGFMVTEGATTIIHEYSEGSIERTHSVCKFNFVDLNPDFNDIPDAFVLDAPNGRRVFDLDFPGARFVWQDGKMVSLVVKSKSLLGKPLPDMKDLKADLSPADIGNKMTLICFFDMEQRPSRKCLRQLSKRAQELKTKDVVVIAVQASKINEDTFNKWVKENNIAFTVGMIEGDEEKIRFNWSVQSLPWLILTDRKHKVLASGFGLNQLDSRIQEAANAEY
jgi:hypothetical protein